MLCCNHLGITPSSPPSHAEKWHRSNNSKFASKLREMRLTRTNCSRRVESYLQFGLHICIKTWCRCVQNWRYFCPNMISFHSVMVTYDEGDYDGGQEDGRPQGEGKMTYSETDPLGRLVTTIHIGQGRLSFLVVMVAILPFFRLSYEGNWEAGQPSGQGCMKFRWSNRDIVGLTCPIFLITCLRSGDSYSGSFLQSLPHGQVGTLRLLQILNVNPLHLQKVT